jgi:hypothetical protein
MKIAEHRFLISYEGQPLLVMDAMRQNINICIDRVENVRHNRLTHRVRTHGLQSLNKQTHLGTLMVSSDRLRNRQNMR